MLGTDFEIHGGGSDLVFPHHENEIAQTEAARGEPLARIWMHNGMVRLEGEKMAKSVGNIALLHEALEQYGPRRWSCTSPAATTASRWPSRRTSSTTPAAPWPRCAS